MTTCPTCDSPLIPIVYGFPGPETFQLAAEGIIRLGGCMMFGPYDDNVACTQCEWVGYKEIPDLSQER